MNQCIFVIYAQKQVRKMVFVLLELLFMRLSMKTDLPCFVPSGGSVVHCVESLHRKKSPPREGGGEKGRLSSNMNSHSGETKQRIRAGAFTNNDQNLLEAGRPRS